MLERKNERKKGNEEEHEREFQLVAHDKNRVSSRSFVALYTLIPVSRSFRQL